MAGDFLCQMKHRMPVLFEAEGVCAGIFQKDAEEYVVLAGTLGGPQGFLIIADKLLSFAQDRTLFLAILDRLNRGSLSGLHQLLEYPGGVIYSISRSSVCRRGCPRSCSISCWRAASGSFARDSGTSAGNLKVF